MILFDTHADTLYRRAGHPGEALDVTPERLSQGGVTVQTMALFVGGSSKSDDISAAMDRMWALGAKLPEEGLLHLTDYRDAKTDI